MLAPLGALQDRYDCRISLAHQDHQAREKLPLSQRAIFEVEGIRSHSYKMRLDAATCPLIPRIPQLVEQLIEDEHTNSCLPARFKSIWRQPCRIRVS